MKLPRFTLQTMFVLTTIAAIWTTYGVWFLKNSAKTYRQNATGWYRTMRANLELWRDTLPPADFEKSRQKIDRDWQKLYPDLPIPDELPASN